MTAQRRYGHVIISYVYWAALADLVPYDTVKVIDLHDFVTLNKYMITGKGEFRLGRMFAGEVRAISKFDFALSISREETLMLSPFCPKTRFVDVPVSFPKRFPKKRGHDFDLLFFGSDNAFNLEGIKWFMKEVYPLLPAAVRIAIVGRVSGHVEKKGNITLIPHVSDVDEVYSRSKLSFCPLKGGTGLKVKVVEALSRL
ncbi:MAG: glycosyltransferase [Deltaproteobacteria bacterium]|nr:glycosyltransferase [Deltaproteobacteria bacterium]